MSSRQKVALLFGFFLAAVLGWSRSLDASGDGHRSVDYWPFDLTSAGASQKKANGESLVTIWKDLDEGFLFPQSSSGLEKVSAASEMAELSDQGREVPPVPVVLGVAYRNSELQLYVNENGTSVRYGVGDELFSGWVFESGDLYVVELGFDNIGLVVDILSRQTE